MNSKKKNKGTKVKNMYPCSIRIEQNMNFAKEKNLIFINKDSRSIDFIRKIFYIENKLEKTSIENNPFYPNKSFSNRNSNNNTNNNTFYIKDFIESTTNDKKNYKNKNNSTINKIIYNKLIYNQNLINSTCLNNKPSNTSNIKKEDLFRIDDDLLIKTSELFDNFLLDETIMNEIDLVINLEKAILVINFEDIYDSYDNREFQRILNILKNNYFKYEDITIIVIIFNLSYSSDKKIIVKDEEFKENQITDIFNNFQIKIKQMLNLENQNNVIGYNKNLKIPIIVFRKYFINELKNILNECLLGINNCKKEKYKIDKIKNILIADSNYFTSNKELYY